MEPNGKPKVLSTIAMIDDLVAEIAGEYIDHTVLIYGEVDPHSYELVKGDGEKFEYADLIFYNGLGLEHGASIQSHLQRHSHAVPLGETIAKEDLLTFDGQIDPHIWMDITLWSHVIDPIVMHLSEIDKEHREIYEQNGKQLKEKMLQKDQELMTMIHEIPQEKRYLVTSHDAFNYFTRRYLANPNENKDAKWKIRHQAPEGLSPEGQISVKDIQKVVDFLCAYDIPVVFSESNINKDSLNKIIDVCKKRGKEVRIATTPLYGDSMGKSGSDADSYLKMLEHNIKTIHTSLSHEK